MKTYSDVHEIRYNLAFSGRIVSDGLPTATIVYAVYSARVTVINISRCSTLARKRSLARRHRCRYIIAWQVEVDWLMTITFNFSIISFYTVCPQNKQLLSSFCCVHIIVTMDVQKFYFVTLVPAFWVILQRCILVPKPQVQCNFYLIIQK